MGPFRVGCAPGGSLASAAEAQMSSAAAACSIPSNTLDTPPPPAEGSSSSSPLPPLNLQADAHPAAACSSREEPS